MAIDEPKDLLNKLSQALIAISKGDPIVALRAELDTRFDAVQTRFEGIEKATELQHQDMVRVPTQVDRAVDSLEKLLTAKVATSIAEVDGKIDKHIGETAEKFSGVGAQFSERDTRTDQRAGDTKLAVDAAFAAAKEATAKIELGFTKQIDAMADTIDTKTRNLADGTSDLKDRLIVLENRAVSTDPQVTATLVRISAALESLQTYRNTDNGINKGVEASWGMVFGVGGIVLAIVSVISLALHLIH